MEGPRQRVQTLSETPKRIQLSENLTRNREITKGIRTAEPFLWRSPSMGLRVGPGKVKSLSQMIVFIVIYLCILGIQTEPVTIKTEHDLSSKQKPFFCLKIIFVNISHG